MHPCVAFSNLVGIEDKIQAIENPLQDFKSQILDFQVHLNSIKVQLEDKLAKRQSLHEQRVALRNLEHIIVTLNKVERLLKLNDNAGDDQGRTIAHYVAKFGQYEKCAFLLKNRNEIGLDFDAEDEEGVKPVDVAISSGKIINRHTVKLFIDHFQAQSTEID